MILEIPPTKSIPERWLDAGCSIIPIRLDGSKKAALTSWKQWQAERPPPEIVAYWFHFPEHPPAIGVVCGVVSGNLEVLDFDDGSLFQPWFQQVEKIACGLPIVETGGGGYHVLYHCEVISPSSKIATDPTRTKSTLIESRGEGSYIVAIGSPPSTHQSGRLYRQVSGPELPEGIPTITPDERLQLWRAARAFDRGDLLRQEIASHQQRIARAAAPPRYGNSAEPPPWELFDQRADWQTLLTDEGWVSADGENWRRPGKTDAGYSAKLNLSQTGQEVLTVFSSNAGIDLWGGHRTLSPSQFVAEVRFNGNWKEAVRWMKGEVIR